MPNFKFTLCQILQKKNKVQNQNDSQQYVDSTFSMYIVHGQLVCLPDARLFMD